MTGGVPRAWRGVELGASVFAACLALGMGALATIHPMAPLAAVVGCVGAAVAVQSPFTMCLAFILVLFTRPAEFVPAIAVLQIGKLTSLGALGLLALSKVLRQDLTWAKASTNLPVLALTVAVFVSSQLGTDPGASMATFKDVFVKILIVYALIVNTVDTERKYVTFQFAIVGACAFIGAYGLWAQVTGTANIEGSRAALVGYLGDPNDMAMTLLCCAPFILQGAASGRGWKRVVFGVLVLVVVGGVLSTQSRGGILGTAGASYFIARDRIKSRAVIVAGMGVMIFTAAMAAGLSSRASGAVGHGEVDESAQGRLDAWDAGGRMVMAKPLFGVGFSRFGDNYETYVVNPVIWGKHETHNMYIKCASETGLIGFGSFMWMLLMALWSAWKARASRSHTDQAWFDIAARGHFCNLVSVGISAFFLSACWSWFIYILAAQAAALGRIDRMRQEQEARS